MDKPKNIILLILSIVLFVSCDKDSHAQVIDTSLVEIRTDKMTGNKTIGSKVMILERDEGGQGLILKVIKSDNMKTVIVSITDVSNTISCTKEGDDINILFLDESKLNLSHSGKFNCDARSVIYFRGLFGQGGKLDELKSKPISAIRIWGMGCYSLGNLDKEQGENFMKALRIVDEYKFE